MAPGIGDGWPEVIPAPHTPNARLKRMDGDPAKTITKLQADLAAERERAEKAESEASRYESLHIRCSEAYVTVRNQLTLAEQQRDAAVSGLENIDAYKLNMLAEWIDLKTQDNPDKEVQSDLRAWARSIDDTLARIRELGEKGGQP